MISDFGRFRSQILREGTRGIRTNLSNKCFPKTEIDKCLCMSFLCYRKVIQRHLSISVAGKQFYSGWHYSQISERCLADHLSPPGKFPNNPNNVFHSSGFFLWVVRLCRDFVETLFVRLVWWWFVENRKLTIESYWKQLSQFYSVRLLIVRIHLHISQKKKKNHQKKKTKNKKKTTKIDLTLPDGTGSPVPVPGPRDPGNRYWDRYRYRGTKYRYQIRFQALTLQRWVIKTWKVDEKGGPT